MQRNTTTAKNNSFSQEHEASDSARDKKMEMNQAVMEITNADPKPDRRAIPRNIGDSLRSFARKGEIIFALMLVALFVATFVAGYFLWSERYYTPEEGLGYYLGMVGGIMMLMACTYALGKRVRKLQAAKYLRLWLTFHIVLGIVGPFMVLIHSTFRIGSMNGGVALISMSLVFLSGVIGRFLYSRIYFVLDGRRAQGQELRNMLRFYGRRIHSKRLQAFQDSVMDEPDDLIHAVYKLVRFNIRSRLIWYGLLHDTKKHIYAVGKRKGAERKDMRRKFRTFKSNLREYMQALRKVALFGVYERAFAFWRHAHVPLLYLLVVSGIVHVIAVHMY